MTTTLPAWVEVDLDALGRNLDRLRAYVGPRPRILLIVKADAYGHGAVEVAREAVRHGVHMLGVATVDEGRELRDAGLDAAILVLSPVLASEIPALVAADLRCTVPEVAFAETLSRHAESLGKRVPVHLEIDTGMGRTGFLAAEALAPIRRIAALPGLLLEGLYTHFPVSDTDPAATRRQVTVFQDVVRTVRATGIPVDLVHASNSAGIVHVRESWLDMVRPGGLVYGVLPHADIEVGMPIESVMSFHARLVQVRRLPARSPISYGGTVVTRAPVIVGVVPVGYGHGLSRACSGSGQLLFRGRRVPILGRVTMDMTMVDLSDFEDPRAGEELVVFGRQGEAEITAGELGARIGALGYEILCGISKRVVRVYKRQAGVESMRGLTGARPVGIGS